MPLIDEQELRNTSEVAVLYAGSCRFLRADTGAAKVNCAAVPAVAADDVGDGPLPLSNITRHAESDAIGRWRLVVTAYLVSVRRSEFPFISHMSRRTHSTRYLLDERAIALVDARPVDTRQVRDPEVLALNRHASRYIWRNSEPGSTENAHAR